MSQLATAEILQLLRVGTIETEGMLPWSSNYTFLVQVCGEHPEHGPVELGAVYKPRRGERPLWDFAQGTLCYREQAAFTVSHHLGWDIVPPTVLRQGEHGLGSVQYFIEHDPERHYFTFEGESDYRTPLQKIVLFDILVNNADRKSGHVLLETTAAQQPNGRLWGIDHGICFHTDYKLRTVIWEFMGQMIPAELLSQLIRLGTQLENPHSSVSRELAELLTTREVQALQKRLQRLIRKGKFPNPGPGRHYPWPPV